VGSVGKLCLSSPPKYSHPEVHVLLPPPPTPSSLYVTHSSGLEFGFFSMQTLAFTYPEENISTLFQGLKVNLNTFSLSTKHCKFPLCGTNKGILILILILEAHVLLSLRSHVTKAKTPLSLRRVTFKQNRICFIHCPSYDFFNNMAIEMNISGYLSEEVTS